MYIYHDLNSHDVFVFSRYILVRGYDANVNVRHYGCHGDQSLQSRGQNSQGAQMDPHFSAQVDLLCSAHASWPWTSSGINKFGILFICFKGVYTMKRFFYNDGIYAHYKTYIPIPQLFIWDIFIFTLAWFQVSIDLSFYSTQESETEIHTRKSSFKNRRQTSMRKTRENALSSIQEYAISRQNTIRRRLNSAETATGEEDNTPTEATPLTSEQAAEPVPEVIWLRRDEVYPTSTNTQTNSFEMNVFPPNTNYSTTNSNSNSADTKLPGSGKKRHTTDRTKRGKQNATGNSSTVTKPCHISRELSPKDGDAKSQLHFRKLVVVEWQRIAAVVDRVLFWVYCIGTFAAYLVILIVIPNENYAKWDAKIERNPNIRSESRYTM